MREPRIIEEQGAKILYLDFSHCTVEEAPHLLAACAKLVRSQPAGSALTLSDFTGSHFDSSVAAKLKEYTKENKPFVKFAAVVGVTGLKKVLYRAVLLFSGRKNLVLCESVADAIAVLVRNA